MKVKQLQRIATAVSVGAIDDVPGIIDQILEGETGKHWNRDLRKLQQTAIDGTPRFTVYTEGNGKLPFLAFSSLPGKGFCPGAGDCLNWCYSFRAWRYPAAFCRQVQNSILQQTEQGRATLLKELDIAYPKIDSMPGYGVIDFRLFVDGDFSSVENLEFWMSALRQRPKLASYGYSKSWREFLTLDSIGFDWPSNYLLNLSSGSVHTDALKRAMAALPITRGDFIAVPMGKKISSNMHNDRAHQAELRKVFGRKAFTCPGKCGDCTPKGHACGSDRFRNIPVIIAVH